MKRAAQHFDFQELRARLADRQNLRYWRSLEELAETPEFQELLACEFPSTAASWRDSVSRRNFLKLMGASVALAGGACSRPPDQKIVPYVTPPEQVVPGKPLSFATAVPLGGYGTGVLVTSHMGRPTKVDGNPGHPASLGGSDAFLQSSVLMLYDPDRSNVVVNRGNVSDWGSFVNALRPRLGEQAGKRGTGLRILTETATSPSLADQIQQVLRAFPAAKWHQYDPVSRENVYEGARQALGQSVNTVYRFDQADVILALDADFLYSEPGHLRYAREFIDRRRVRTGRTEMNRLYAVEPTPSITGTMADHRLAIRCSQVEAVARAVAAALGAGGTAEGVVSQPTGGSGEQLDEKTRAWIAAVTTDLQQHRGRSIVIAGMWQPPSVHALAHAINQALGNVWRTLVYTDPVEANPVNHHESLRELAADMESGAAQVLLILGGNPAYTAPGDLEFAQRLLDFSGAQQPDGTFRNFTAHLGLYDDETAFNCQWHVPQTHFLEGWGDVRAFDGTVSIIQPLIGPLYPSKSEHEVLAAVQGRLDVTSYELVRSYWRARTGGAATQPVQTAQAGEASTRPSQTARADESSTGEAGFEQTWRGWLEKGLIPGTALPERDVRMAGTTPPNSAVTSQPGLPATAREDLEVVFRPDASVWDGSFANVGWQQELPRPFTKLTWDNAALVSPRTAERLGLTQGQRVELLIAKPQAAPGESRTATTTPSSRSRVGGDGHSVTAPVWVLPGQADEVITLHLGYGRTRVGHVGKGVGFSAYAIRDSREPWAAGGVTLQKMRESHAFASPQRFQTVDSRALGGRFAPEVVDRTDGDPGSKLPGLSSTNERVGEVRAGEVRAGEVRLGEVRAGKGETGSSHDNRKLIRVGTAEQFRKDPGFVKEMEPEAARKQASLLPPFAYEGYKWGMSIDLNACIGCNACVVACVAENNVPVVGKDQVGRGRIMHWLRVDGYFAGELDNPEYYHQPVPCMHCERAPCELVCPVGATVHDSEGINNMIYNRCVGTRYCSNNCPYKVRRFNFYYYSDDRHPTVAMQKNPNVTVRARGVMEKCTYCIQRVAAARMTAEKEDRRVRDGEVQTACQQACPTRAIIFGDLNDPGSEVSRLKATPLDYGLLMELTTTPRTTYMARLRNPNPAIGT